MLRRSSKRALSSTRQTPACRARPPSISAGTSGESSLVRYTVCLIASTSGSRGRLRTNASKLVANESYGWWTRTSPRADRREDVAGLASARRRPGDRAHGSSFSSGRSSRGDLHQVGEVEHPRGRVDLSSVDAQRLAEPLAASRATSARRPRAAPPRRSAAGAARLDRLEQVVGLVGDLEVGVAGDAEDGVLEDLHPGEEREVWAITSSSGTRARACRARRSAAGPRAP